MLKQPRPLVPFTLGSRFTRQPYKQRVLATQPGNLIAYFPLDETSGSAAVDATGLVGNGTYSGVTLNATTFADGTPAPSFDGSNDYVDIYSSALASAFDSASGSVMYWMKVSSGFWSDHATRLIFRLGTSDFGNRIFSVKDAADVFNARYLAGGVDKQINASTTSTNWLQGVMTWNKAGNVFQFFINGSSVGTLGSLGTWSGVLNNGTTVIGANTNGGQFPFLGNIAHVAIWNTPLSAPQIADLAQTA